ncbi:hypothetical protein [Agromyces sp. LHK192]|uniref:hypothetical protein n=1 Tax=Agromyces sp. LHK192 TaxID=2498704 RepID=UPI000FD81D57|nr:hypothetical protein [Agromyces sp. LHK192]
MPATDSRLGRSDRVGMYLTIAIGAIGAVGIAATAVTRLVEVLPGTDVPVLVPFMDETAPLPIGPDGALVDVQVDRAVVTVPQPAAATQFALVAEPIVAGLTMIIAVALLGWFAWTLARGSAFTRRNVRVFWIGTFTILGGWVLGGLFTTMGVNGALSAVSDYTYDGVLFSTDFGALLAILALGVVGAAFQVGERLQRDSEGLV